jgi:hypothetical protein
MHGCRYTTDTSYKEFEQMRIGLEPLVYAYGVDIFFYGAGTQALDIHPTCLMQQLSWSGCHALLLLHHHLVPLMPAALHAGHVHAYERSTPVYNYTVDLCGPVHITVGAALTVTHLP